MKFLRWQQVLVSLEDGTYPTEINRELKFDQKNVFEIIKQMERENILNIREAVNCGKRFIYLTKKGVSMKKKLKQVIERDNKKR